MRAFPIRGSNGLDAGGMEMSWKGAWREVVNGGVKLDALTI